MREILEEVRARGVMTAVGGADGDRGGTEEFEGVADVIFVGEADETWPEFLRDWELDHTKVGTLRRRRLTWQRCRCRGVDL